MAFRITCVNKAGGQHENPYVAISDLGWENDQTRATGRSTREQMYDFVKGGGDAYVQSGGWKAQLITAISPRGTKYVKTVPDNTVSDNLLKLPECR
jgi:hypothetical protein